MLMSFRNILEAFSGERLAVAHTTPMPDNHPLSADCGHIFNIFATPFHIATDLINGLPGNSSVITVHHATIQKAVLSVDPDDAPTDWLAIT
jgi:hypothetical protein